MMARMVNKKISGMIELIEELQADAKVPKNVKTKLEFCANALNEGSELPIRVDKVKHAIEELSEDSNLESYTRMQIWNLASMLEKL